MNSILICCNVAGHAEFYQDSYGSMWLPLVMQGVSKISFTIVILMLLCDECYENVYT
jgi:hypothetical protein